MATRRIVNTLIHHDRRSFTEIVFKPSQRFKNFEPKLFEEEVKQLERISTFSECCELAGTAKLQKASRQLLLVKMSHLCDVKNSNEFGASLAKRVGFKELLVDLRSDLSQIDTTVTGRLTILQALLRVGLFDQQVLQLTCDQIERGQFFNIAHLTTALWVIAKFKFKANNTNYLTQAIKIMLRQEDLQVTWVCRNLWNLYTLDFKSVEALDRFTEIILKSADQLGERDIANSVKAFAHFDYFNYDCLELLLKWSIKNAAKMRPFSLAVTVDAFTQLEVFNQTLFNVTRQVVYKGIDNDELKPIECIFFLGSFLKGKLFLDPVVRDLELYTLRKLNTMNGHEVALFFNNHAILASWMLDECFVRKRMSRHEFQKFYNFNDSFYEQCATRLVKVGHDVTYNNTVAILQNGMTTNLKRHAQIRIMYNFMLQGVTNLTLTKDTLGDQFEPNCVCYFEIGKRYCHGKEQLSQLKQAFHQHGIDIDTLHEKHYTGSRDYVLPYLKNNKQVLPIRNQEWDEQMAESISNL